MPKKHERPAETDDDVVAPSELGEEPGDVPGVVLAASVDDDEFIRPELPCCIEDRLQRPAVAPVGLGADDDRPERLGNPDGIVR